MKVKLGVLLCMIVAIKAYASVEVRSYNYPYPDPIFATSTTALLSLFRAKSKAEEHKLEVFPERFETPLFTGRNQFTFSLARQNNLRH